MSGLKSILQRKPRSQFLKSFKIVILIIAANNLSQNSATILVFRIVFCIAKSTSGVINAPGLMEKARKLSLYSIHGFRKRSGKKACDMSFSN